MEAMVEVCRWIGQATVAAFVVWWIGQQ